MKKNIKVTCTRNLSKPPKYNTHFKWESLEIFLDYHYNDDVLKIFVDGANWIDGDNKILDPLISLLSDDMLNLVYEDCKVGEELIINIESDK